MKTFKTLRRRSLALILALTMCLSMVQTTALAVDEMTNDPGHSFEVTDVYEETSTDSSKGTGTDSKDLTVTNSPSEEYPVVGEEFSYTITVKNPNSKAISVMIADPLGEKLEFVAADNGGIYDETTRTVVWTGIEVAAHDVKRIKVQVTANVAGEIYNEVRIECEVNETSGNTTVTAKEPESRLSISKTAMETSVEVGDTMTYAITVKNTGSTTATGAKIIDVLDTEYLEWVGANYNWTAPHVPGPDDNPDMFYSNDAGTKIYGTVPNDGEYEIDHEMRPGAELTLTIIAKVIKVGTVENTATVEGDNIPETPSNRVVVTVIDPNPITRTFKVIYYNESGASWMSVEDSANAGFLNMPEWQMDEGVTENPHTTTISDQVPTRAGYVFDHWQWGGDVDATFAPGDTIALTANPETLTEVAADLYAVWDDAICYKLKYDANGGKIRSDGDSATTMTDEANSFEDSYIFTVKTAPETDTNFDPTWAGHELLGWADTKDAKEVTYQAGAQIRLDKTAPTKTIYAVWKAIMPSKPTDTELYNLRLGVRVVCDVQDSGHKTMGYTLNTSKSVETAQLKTISDVTANTGSNKEQYPYTCTVTVTKEQQNSFWLTQNMADGTQKWNAEHKLLDDAQDLSVTLYWDGNAWVDLDAPVSGWHYMAIHTEHKSVNPKLTGITKERLTEAPTGVTLNLQDKTVNYDRNVVFVGNNAPDVTLLYKITVTGTKGAAYKVTDNSAVLVGGDKLTGTLGESGEAVIYVIKTFCKDNVANGKLTNTATLESNDPVGPNKPNGTEGPTDGNVTEETGAKKQYNVIINFKTSDETPIVLQDPSSTTVDEGGDFNYGIEQTSVRTESDVSTVTIPRTIAKNGKTYALDEPLSAAGLSKLAAAKNITADVAADIIYSLDEKGSISVETHTVTWVNWNGTNLYRISDVTDGAEIPSSDYVGRIPIRQSDGFYIYQFIGWSMPAVDKDGNVTYTAQFMPVLVYNPTPIKDKDSDTGKNPDVGKTPDDNSIESSSNPDDVGITTITDPNLPLEGAIGLNNEDHFAYIIGYDTDHVKPLNNITRAEVATIFFRLMTDENRSANWSTSNHFSDVKAGSWFNNAISTCANAGALKGYTDGSFRPNASITRAEFAAIAARFLDPTKNDDNGVGNFADTANHWAAKEIRLAAKAGWVYGDGNGNMFRPDDYITRAEVMTIVNRMLNRIPNANHMLDTMKKWVDNPADAWYYEAVQEATNEHAYERDELGAGEIWTTLLPIRNWKALETEWASSNA